MSRTYTEKLIEPTVIEIVNKNRKACEPIADAVDEAEQGNEDVRDEIIANATISDEMDSNNNKTFCGTQVTPLTPLISDETLGD